MKPCGKPGLNKVTHCVEPEGHEGFHMYAPIPRPDDPLSDQLEGVMRLLTQSCPDYQVGDFVTTRPKCCPYHHAAATVIEAQKLLRKVGQ